MTELLALAGGLAWAFAYIEAVRIGFRDKTYAIPSAILIFNLTWELFYAVYGYAAHWGMQAGINILWLLTDIAVFITFLKFGRREFPVFVTRSLFAGWIFLVFASSFIVNASFIYKMGWEAGALYSAFLSNVVMSGLFIAMFVSRRGGRGQSLGVAIAKYIGTLAATIHFGYLDNMPAMLMLGSICTLFDLVYITLLAKARQNPQTFSRMAQ